MKKILTSLAAGVTLLTGFAAQAQESVNIYSFRQAFLIEPILVEFTKETGIKTNIVFAKKGLVERLKREGKHSPADVVLTSNFGALLKLEKAELTQTIDSETINNNVPALYRDPEGQWVALTKRVRNIYTAKSLADGDSIRYEDLASPKFKGQICTRSGKHPYNLGLVSSMIAYHGEAETKKWLEGVKANLARRPQGNDRAQVKAIKEGLCKVSLGNSYYLGKMVQDPKQKAWADAVNIQFPNQADRGSHINVSGATITPHAPNKDNALKLIEFLTSDKAQQMYAAVNMEYPVKEGVPLSELVSSWGEFKSEDKSIAEISQYRQAALKLIDEVKFDL
ncbi:extracellular solute-binding protein [Catenovulum sp. SM1970]|uniref:extracellular solute-binding protein n=1 Tax=Marinifaba aquimaris TaxID=2741323 RepID=UPI001572D436|nr:extracellular solute-binding protein [Marinifaba aquimaris]NTS77575.1 extracellular solute-binding protein [Marinifaba aquimaris]